MNTSDSGSTPGVTHTTLSADERTWGMLAHFVALAGLVLTPVGAVLAPLIVWLTRRDQSAFVGENAKEALNFNISVLLGYLVCARLWVVHVGILLTAVLFVYWLIMTIIAGIKASEGVHFRYPVSLRLVK